MQGIRQRFNLRFDRHEIAGSIGDIGTFLPLVVGLVNRCGMNLGHILFFSGAWSIVAGLRFGIPVPVQPMKAIAIVAIAEGLNVEAIMAAGFLAGLAMLVLAQTGLIDTINKTVPKSVVRGLQLAVGLKLLIKGVEMVVSTGRWLALDSVTTGITCFMLILLLGFSRRIPGALAVFSIGVVLLFVESPGLLSRLGFGWEIPKLIIPSAGNLVTGFWRGTVPQLPLTILNSVVAVCALSRDLFPERPLAPKKVAAGVGLMNLVSCPFGGMPMCHGSGGLAAQYRFGARTGGSMVFLGSAQVILAVVFGGSLLTLLGNYPDSVLGVLLAFGGLELTLVCRDQNERTGFFIMALTAGVCIATNIALGFVIGLGLSLLVGKGLVRLEQPGNPDK